MAEETIKNESYSTHFDHLADLENHIGKELGLSKWITVTQENVNLFAKLTEDEQWIHVDVERSKKESPYKQTIAHGFYIISFASRFSYDCITIGDVVMGVNYGMNKVRFMSPTPVGAKVRGRISLLHFEAIPKGAKYIMKIIFEIEGQEKPACVAEFVAQAYTAN